MFASIFKSAGWGHSRSSACQSAALAALLAVLACSSSALASHSVFRVQGTGDTDNTAAIQAAFDSASAAGPGSVVELAGMLFTNEISIDGFDGVVRGDPHDPPTVDVLRGLDPSLPGVSLAEPVPGIIVPHPLFEFSRSNVRMVGPMTFHISAENPAELHNGPFVDMTELKDILRFSVDTTARVKDVTFRGAPVAAPRPFASYNVRVGIAVFGGPIGPRVPPVTADVTISDSAFSEMIIAVSQNGATDGRLIVRKNVMSDVDVGVISSHAKDSFIRINHNEIRSAFAAALIENSQEPGPPEPIPVDGMTQVSLTGNTIDAEGVFGLLINDHGGFDPAVSSMQVDVHRNRISGGTAAAVSLNSVIAPRVTRNDIVGAWFSGIEAINGSNDCWVAGNNLGRHRQTGETGIDTIDSAISIRGSEGCNLVLNHFTDVTGTAVNISETSRFNRVGFNNYRRSGISECAVRLQGDNNVVTEFAFPRGTDASTQVCNTGAGNTIN